MRTARHGDVEIAYEVDGPAAGEPLILIMGMGTQLVAWPPEIVHGLIERGFRVIRMDNRDVGLSTWTTAPPPARRAIARALAHRRLARADYTVPDMAGDALAVLDHLGVDRAHLVGASMGGMIAQQVAIDAPDRAASLTSIMSNTGDRRHGLFAARFIPTFTKSMMVPRPSDPEGAVAAGVAAFRVISGPHFDDREVEGMVRMAVARGINPVASARQLLAILASPDRTPGLQQLSLPTLVIHGLADPLVLPSGGIATARAVPGSRLLLLPDMAHDFPLRYRADMVDAIAANARRPQWSVDAA